MIWNLLQMLEHFNMYIHKQGQGQGQGQGLIKFRVRYRVERANVATCTSPPLIAVLIIIKVTQLERKLCDSYADNL